MDGKRFTQLTPDNLNAEQKVIYERTEEGPRKHVGAPLNAMLHSPGVADAFERLGAYTRFHTDIPDDLGELLILLVSRHFTAQYPWAVHYKRGQEMGLSKQTVEAIESCRRPSDLKPLQELVYDFCQDLLDGKGVSDATYAGMHAKYGEQGILDFVGLMGYYTMLSLAITTDRYPPPAGICPPLAPR